MSGTIGTSLLYSTECSAGFKERVTDTVSAFIKNFTYIPHNKMEIRIWPSVIQWRSGDSRIEYYRNIDILHIRGGKGIQDYTIESYSANVRKSAVESTVSLVSIPSRRLVTVSNQKLRLNHDRLTIAGNEFDLWSSADFPVPPSISTLVWSLWLQGSIQQVPSGVPYEIYYHDPDEPDKIWMRLRLQEIQTLTRKAPKAKVNKAPILRSKREKVMSIKREISKKPISLLKRGSQIAWSNWWQSGINIGMGMNKVGVAFEQPALEQLAGALNHAVSRFGAIEGAYDYSTNELEIDLNFWERLGSQLVGSIKSLGALSQLVVAAHLLNGGQPVTHWQREGGLSAVELTRVELLRRIIQTFSYTDGRWIVDIDAYNEIHYSHIHLPEDEQYTDRECPAIVKKSHIFHETWNLLHNVQTAFDSSPGDVTPENVITLTHLLMLGITDFKYFSYIDYLLSDIANINPMDLQHTALGVWDDEPQVEPIADRQRGCRRTLNQTAFHPQYNQLRAEQFIEAQMRQLLGFKARIPKQDMQKVTKVLGNSYLFLGPIYYFNILPANPGINGLRHEGNQIRTNLDIAKITASVSVSLLLEDGIRWLLIAAISGFFPFIGMGIVNSYTRGGVILDLSNVVIPLRFDFVPAKAGYDMVIHNDQGNDGTLMASIGRDDSVYNFPWPVNEIISAMRGDITRILRDLLSHLFGTSAGDANAILNDMKFPLPWPAILNLLGSPGLTRFEPQGEASTLNMWAIRRALWARTPANGVGTPTAGIVDLSDIDSLGYVFSPCALSSWLRAMLSIPGNRSINNAQGFLGARGVSLPALTVYAEPEQVAKDRAANAMRISMFSNICGNAPPVAASQRTYRLDLNISAPDIKLEEGTNLAAVGKFRFACSLSIKAVQIEEYAQPIVTNTGSDAIPLNPEGFTIHTGILGAYAQDNSEQMSAIDTREQAMTESSEALDYIMNTTADDEGSIASSEYGTSGASCNWDIHQTVYPLSELAEGAVEVTGEFLLGFSAAGEDVNVDTITPELVLPQLALAPVRNADLQPQLEISAHLDLADDMSSDEQAVFTSELKEMCRQEVLWIINNSRSFGHSVLTGSRWVLPLPFVLSDALPVPVRQARWIQESTNLGADDKWDNSQHAFRYIVRNGHAVWPIRLELDLQRLLP